MLLKGASILAVDGRGRDGGIWRRRIVEAGARVVQADTLTGALAMATADRFDLVLLAGDTSGTGHFLDRIKKVSWRPIVLSATDPGQSVANRLSALAAGVDALVSSEADAAELIGTMAALLRLRRAEAVIAEREERLCLAVAAAHMSTWDWDVVSGVVRWSENLEPALGMAPGSFAGTFDAFRALVHPEDRQRVEQRLRDAFDGRAEYEIEFRMLRPDGTVRWTSTKGTVLRDPQGRPRRMVGVDVDVTRQKEAEAELQNQQKWLELAQQSAGIGVWEWDLTTNRSLWSREFCMLFGFDPETVEPGYAAFRARVHPDDIAALEAHLREVIAEGRRFVAEFRILRGDGVRWMLGRGNLVRSEDGEPRRMIGINFDITAQKETEARLRALADAASQDLAERQRSEQRFKIALGSSPVVVFEQDRDLRYTWIFNPKLGYTAEQWIGMSDAEMMDPACLPALTAFKRGVMETGRPARTEAPVAAPGQPVEFYDLYGEPRRDAAGAVVGIICAATDISERKRIETALREGEERLRLAIEAGQVGVFDWDLRTGELCWDARVRALFGVPQDAAVTIETFYAALHPDDAARVQAAVHASLDPARGGDFAAEYRVLGLADGRERHVAARGRVRFDDGRAVRMIGTAVDMTAQRRADAILERDKSELERLVEERTRALQEAQVRLARSEKLTALGQLAGGIAHDFNNVLQAVRGGAEMLRLRAGDPDAVRRFTQMIDAAARRGVAVTDRLLAFAHRSELRWEAIDPAALLASMADLLERTLGARIKIRVEVPARLPPLRADRAQLETVLVNIAANARDAMPGGGTLTLAARLEVLDEDGAAAAEPARKTPALEAGAYVRLCLTDTGEGIPSDVFARVTEVFFTTKPVGQGTGLGLALAKGFAEQSGGGLGIESAPGAGTTVTLWLPVATAPTPADAATAPLDPGTAVGDRRARILLVDDDPIVRVLLEEQIRASGHGVLAAESGSAALALLDAGEAVDLIATDLSMPRMDGIAVIREAQRRRPGLPAILLTGSIAAAGASDADSESSFSVLRKPVSGRELAARMAMLLALSDTGRR